MWLNLAIKFVDSSNYSNSHVKSDSYWLWLICSHIMTRVRRVCTFLVCHFRRNDVLLGMQDQRNTQIQNLTTRWMSAGSINSFSRSLKANKICAWEWVMIVYIFFFFFLGGTLKNTVYYHLQKKKKEYCILFRSDTIHGYSAICKFWLTSYSCPVGYIDKLNLAHCILQALQLKKNLFVDISWLWRLFACNGQKTK